MAGNNQNNQNKLEASASTNTTVLTNELSQNPASLYYVHPTENTTALTIKTTLTGPNYHTWARAIKRALIPKNKYDFLISMIP